jgi:hypothetical protein
MLQIGASLQVAAAVLDQGTRVEADFEIVPGAWQRGGRHEAIYGNRFNATKTFRWRISPGVEARLLQQSSRYPARDIYEFGVYTGGTMHDIGNVVPQYRHMWGFDSFRGLPKEASGVHVEGKHWGVGAFSAADALDSFRARHLLDRITRRIGHPNVTLIPGFFNESLPGLQLSRFRPALLVDVDVDLYVSAIQCLRWMFDSGLIVPGTLVRYDDWHNNSPGWGEMKAHDEISADFQVKWLDVGEPDVQAGRWTKHDKTYEVLSIGAQRRPTTSGHAAEATANKRFFRVH